VRVLKAIGLDPYRHLAAEDQLLNAFVVDAPQLLLWRSGPTVVIGKNQNPWMECDLHWMTANGVQLARRISGGGAVYHDDGNLNYAFFLPRATYRQEAVFGWILDVLASLGFAAERVNRTSLVVGGKKISGNAFCYRRDAVLHHGTLLVSSDLFKLRRVLQPASWSFTTRATASVPMSVANLADLQPGLSLADVESAFVDRFGGGVSLPYQEAVDPAEFVGDDWLWNRTPECHVDTGAGVFHVQHGMIAEGPAEWLGRSFAEWYAARGV